MKGHNLHLTYVWLLVLSLLSAFSHAEALKGACLPQGTALQGLTARFYSYTYGSLIAQSSSAYISGGYRSTKYLGSTTGWHDTGTIPIVLGVLA